MSMGSKRYQTFFADLKRRQVFKVAAVYGAIAFAVMQAADFLVPALRLPDSVATAIALLAIIAFPFAMALAWVFDLTPKGIVRTDAADSGELEAIVAQSAHRRWPAGLLAVAGTALLVGGAWWVLGSGSSAGADEPGRTKLVVLPFQNLGPSEHEYFADGIAEEITSRLAVIAGLGVISRTSAIQYKGTDKTLQQIAQDLDVDYVLEGTILWQERPDAPSRVRVTPQLIRVSDDTHVWAERYDAVLADIFEVQSSIARQVIEALNVALLEPDRERLETRPTDNLEAYDYYLRGNDYAVRSISPRDLEAAIRLYGRAVELDPRFAAALAGLAKVHLQYHWFGYAKDEDHVTPAKAAADRAIALAPDLPDAHIALGFYHYYARQDFEGALREFDIARQARPNDSELWSGIAYVNRRQARWEESLAAQARALELDPRDYELTWNQGLTYHLLRRYEEADALYDRAVSLAPDATDAYVMKAVLYAGRNGGTEPLKDLLRTVTAVSDPALFFTQLLTLTAETAVFRIDVDYQAGLSQLTKDQPGLSASSYFLSRTGYFGTETTAELEHAYYDSARAALEAGMDNSRAGAIARAQLGIAYAGLGRDDDAIRIGRAAVEDLPVDYNALEGTFMVRTLAEIYVMVGEPELAIEQLESLMSVPSFLSSEQLRADPFWAPLRGNPQFEALLTRR
jgi:TolB-like protein